MNEPRTRLAKRLAPTIMGLRAMLAAYAHAYAQRAPKLRLVPLLVLVYFRLARLVTRLDRLILRWQAGEVLTPRPSRPTPYPRPRPKSGPQSDPAAPPLPATPKSDFWLVRRVQSTAQFGGQIGSFLEDPQTRALVESAPQAGRLLRPLCRMLGVPLPDWLRLPERPRASPALPPPRPAKPPRRAPAPLLRPLQPYVLAAARAWRPKSA